MKISFKQTLLAGSALLAAGSFVIPGVAQAGNSANLVVDGGGAGAVPPAAGETLEVQDNTTNAIWDADDGNGSATSDIEFEGGGAGASSLLIEDSTGAGPIVVRDIYVTDDASATTLDVNGTNGNVNLQVVGDVRNDDGAGTDLSILLTEGGNSAVLSFNGDAAQVVTATIDGGGAAEGSLVVDNAVGVTFDGDIGANDTLASVDVYADGIAVFNGQVLAGSINLLADSTTTVNADVTITDDIELNAGAVLNVGDGVEIDGAIDATADSVGTLNFAGDGTVTGVIGATEDLAAININGDNTKTVTFEDNVSTTLLTINEGVASFEADLTGDVHFADDGVLEFAGDGTATGDITVETDGEGEIRFISATTTVTGTVGDEDARLGAITGPTNGADTGTFESAVFADLITIDAGDLVFEDVVDATDIDFNGTGEITFEGDLTTENGIDFDGNAGTVNFADGADLEGNIIDSDDGAGTVNFAGTSTVTGDLGQAGAGLLAVNGGADGEILTIDGDVVAATITVAGEYTEDVNGPTGGVVMFGGNVTGNVVLSDLDGSAAGFGALDGVTTNVTRTIDGNITSGADNQGVISVMSNAGQTSTVTFDGTIGVANDLALIGIESTSHAIFNGNVLANEIMFVDEDRTSTARVTFGDGADFTGDIVVEGDDAGTVNFLGDTTVTGNIGSAGNEVLAINGGAAGKLVEITGTIDALDINVTGAGTIATNGAVNADDVTIATGGTFEINNNTVAVANGIANSGRVLFATNGGIVEGDITGTGDIDADAGATIRGSVDVGDIVIRDTDTLTISSVNGDVSVEADSILIEDTAGDNAGLTLDADGNDIEVLSVITTANDGEGRVLTSGDSAVTFAADLGDTDDAIGLLSITETSAVTAAGNLYVADTEIADGASLTLTGSDVTVTGTVGGVAGGGQGALNVASGANVTFESAIGGTALDLFNVDGTANISNNVTTTAANATTAGLVVDGTLNINADANSVTISETLGDIDFNGTVEITGIDDAAAGNVVIDAAGSDLFIDGVFTTSLLEAGATTTLGGDNSIVIGGTSNTTVNIGNQIVLGDALTLGRSGGINTILAVSSDNFDPAAVAAVIDADGQAVVGAAGSVTRFGVGSGTTVYEAGDTVVFIDDATGSDFDDQITDGRITFVNNGLVTYDSAASDANTLVADIAFNDASEVFGDTIGGGAANALLGFPGATGGLATIRSNLIGATSQDEAQQIAESISPTVDGGFVAAGFQASSLSTQATNTRLASARTGEETGMTAGDMGDGMTMWTQGFGQLAQQDRRDGVAGFDADTYGIAVGIDTEKLADDTVVGVSLSYANTDVESDNANSTDTDIDSYQISLYGDHDLQDGMYLAGMVGFAHNSVDQTRHDVGGIAGNDANADFDTQQYIVHAELGKEYVVGGNMSLTPHALAHYQHLTIDSYTESGSTANLSVDNEELDLFELGIGATAEWDLHDDQGQSIRPSVNVGYRYDLIGDEIQTTSNFTGGGASFETDGADPARSTFNIGTAVTYELDNNWALTADYDYEIKSDFDAHSGMVRAGYKF